MYKLVAIDLDGTLLNSRKEVSEENIRTIKRVVEKGVKVVICSGRIFKAGSYYASLIGTREPVIACNGAVIKEIEGHKLIYDNPLSLGDCLRIIDICHGEKVYFHAYVQDTMYAEMLEFDALDYWKARKQIPEEYRFDIRIVDNFMTVITKDFKPVSKFVVISDDFDQLTRVRKEIESIDGVTVASSRNDNFEVYRSGVSKGNALRILSERLGIDRQQIVAIGDNENDYTMIKYAGLGIAMGNAEDIIKSMADDVTLDNDCHGVAEALKKYIL